MKYPRELWIYLASSLVGVVLMMDARSSWWAAILPTSCIPYVSSNRLSFHFLRKSSTSYTPYTNKAKSKPLHAPLRVNTRIHNARPSANSITHADQNKRYRRKNHTPPVETLTIKTVYQSQKTETAILSTPVHLAPPPTHSYRCLPLASLFTFLIARLDPLPSSQSCSHPHAASHHPSL